MFFIHRADIARNAENEAEQVLLGLQLGRSKTAIRDFREGDMDDVDGLGRRVFNTALE